MALVCESTPPEDVPPNEDLEDGEIEDDGEDELPPVEAEKPKDPENPVVKLCAEKDKNPENKLKLDKDRVRRHEEKKRHMTEAEKSILHLRRREKMQREKWEKFRMKEQQLEPPVVDDFAINLEKAIASVLKKDKHPSDDDKEEEKRGRKRKNRDKERLKGAKQRKGDSPKGEEVEESDEKDKESKVASLGSEESYDSEYSSDVSKGEEKRNKREFKSKRKGRSNKKKNRELRNEQQQNQLKDSQGVCVFFLQGKCQKNDCPYSHEAMPPMKLELCKFYLKECCAKGEKCSYMHSEFPCKFYHTGLMCVQGADCKFAHGGPLDEHRKQILFKHIETAPRDILGGFPRMSREETLNKINLTQQSLFVQYGGVEDKFSVFDVNVGVPMEAAEACPPKAKGEKTRNRPSRWQDPDPQPEAQFNFAYSKDQDMRVTSNGDIDMRTLPLQIRQLPDEPEANFTQDIDIRNPNMLQFDTRDVDIRMDPRLLAARDVDIRQIPVFDAPESARLEIEPSPKSESVDSLPADLPKTQRDLFLRIQQQQRTNLPEPESDNNLEIDDNINWYSDDDDEDENRLTIKVDNEEEGKKEESDTLMSPPQVKPQEVVEKLGDLSKIDISAEVTKLLTSMTQQKAEKPAIRDPRQLKQALASQEQKVSIYEQGSISVEGDPKSPDEVLEGDLRSRPDVDLRNLHLPFKGMQNYTPAKEIDASINSHPHIEWKVHIVEIPRPDYTGLKLNIQDAEKTGDPRLRKIFRLSTEEKDSPASPKASPKATRIDPRLRKMEEKQDNSNLSYNQQLNLLQSSAFFQSLTSNQKVLLNQELASRNEQTGLNDPVLNSMLSTLNLIPNTNLSQPNMGAAAMNILNKLNPGPMAMGQNPNMMNPMVQPGLLGAAPGIPNDFPFDPRQGQGQFGNFQDNFGQFDDYYPPQQDNFRDNRGFNRDRRRGRNHFNRNNGNRNFRNRNNRNNRGHTPP